jgi:Arc/MetJ-type ribon-helix-helix transcriptional regulator
MKTLTVRLPEPLAAEIEAESRKRGMSKSDIVRERLKRGQALAESTSSLADIADLIGSVEGLQSDLSARKKHYLRTTGFGRDRRR